MYLSDLDRIDELESVLIITWDRGQFGDNARGQMKSVTLLPERSEGIFNFLLTESNFP